MKRLRSKDIQSSLLKWFRKNKRPLPWRKTRDPYRIWISEMMLQQTQVNTVIPYYERWMKNFPTLERLAGSPLSRVLKSWEGLGYYSRARNLHRTAKIVLKQFKGQFPCSAEELRKLPGIGRYTAGAVASIAFNRPEPILDGNVKRVLARIFAVREPVNKARGEKRLWEIARTLVGTEPLPRHCEGAKRPKQSTNLQIVERAPRPEIASGRKERLCGPRNDGKAGDFNQSLMELGALVCLPENPNCPACPVAKICEAHRLGKEREFPVKAAHEKTEELKTVAVVLWKRGRVLLQKQAAEGRWGGLWTFPHWMSTNGQKEKDFVRNRLKKDLGLRAAGLHPRTELRHGFTKYRVRLRVYEGGVKVILRPSIPNKGPKDLDPSPPSAAQDDRAVDSVIARRRSKQGRSNLQAWFRPADLRRLPLPRPHQRIAELLQSHA